MAVYSVLKVNRVLKWQPAELCIRFGMEITTIYRQRSGRFEFHQKFLTFLLMYLGVSGQCILVCIRIYASLLFFSIFITFHANPCMAFCRSLFVSSLFNDGIANDGYGDVWRHRRQLWHAEPLCTCVTSKNSTIYTH